MINNPQYISINEILSRVLDHPLLRDTTLEQVVRYTADFIRAVGMPTFFEDKEVDIEIKDYRGLLPCDLYAVHMVKDKDSGYCLRATTDVFSPEEDKRRDLPHWAERSFKVQGSIIITSFKEGVVTLAYRSIPVDEHGFPLILDNATFLRALEAYIKMKKFQILFHQNKVNQAVYTDVQQDYYVNVALCRQEFSTPSISEMEAISRMCSRMLEIQTEFDRGFKTLGDRQYYRQH